MSSVLRSAFQWFYCLPIFHIIILLLFTTSFFLYLQNKYGKKLLWGISVLLAHTIWIVAIIYITIVSRGPAHSSQHSFLPFHSYREVLNGGNIEILRSNFMNVMLFYPAGLLFCSLLPQGWRKWHKVLLTVVVFCALSCGIEYMQYAFSLGHVEIDDVIHNAFGALLGGMFCFIPLEPWRWFQIVHPSE